MLFSKVVEICFKLFTRISKGQHIQFTFLCKPLIAVFIVLDTMLPMQFVKSFPDITFFRDQPEHLERKVPRVRWVTRDGIQPKVKRSEKGYTFLNLSDKSMFFDWTLFHTAVLVLLRV